MSFDRIIAVRNTKTVYRDGNRCIKVFGPSHTKLEVVKEALNSVHMEELGICLPKLLAVEAFDGKWALIYEYISGETLDQLMERHRERKPEYIERFADIQLSLQEHSCPALDQMKERLRERIGMLGLEAKTRRELLSRLKSIPSQTKVCHGDFNPSNVIISDDNIPYVIDWANVTQGNVLADAAMTYLLLQLDGEDNASEMYLKYYCQKRGVPKQEVLRWVSVSAALRATEGSEKEREFFIDKVNAL